VTPSAINVTNPDGSTATIAIAPSTAFDRLTKAPASALTPAKVALA
jgi:hypothetical protein